MGSRSAGGLCLAQGLKKDHVEVEVYDRDHSPLDRLQGYRLSITETGRRALKACFIHAPCAAHNYPVDKV